MENENFLGFDDFIVAPHFDKESIQEWFHTNRNGKGVYAVYSKNFECLYVGATNNLKRRLPEHLKQDKLKGRFDDVLFIGIKYIEGDPLTNEKQFIRKLEPTLNKYRYRQ
jgi:excinuclease UvrABC nuclease subunit